jgi:hypothetical protein
VTSQGRRVVGSAVLVACALAVVGSSASAAESQVAGDWIGRADAACARANEQIRALDSDPANRTDSGGWERVQATFTRFRAISREELARVRDVQLPKRLGSLLRMRDKALGRQYEAAEQRDLEGFEQAGEDGTDAFVPFVLLAHRYGMHACADSVGVRASASAGAGAIVRGALAVTWWCNAHEGVLAPGDATLVAGAARELVATAHGHPDATVPYLVATTGAPRTFRAALRMTLSTLRSCGTAPLAARLAREAAATARAVGAG